MRTKILGIVVSLMFVALPLAAQRNSASVTGHVYDPSGAPIPGATITATETRTGAVNTTQTNAVGLYQFPFLSPGDYQFTFSKQGFEKYIQSGVTLQVAQSAVVDAKLQLGAVTQSIKVTANASMLQTTSGSTDWSISAQRIAAIPIGDLASYSAAWYALGVTVTTFDDSPSSYGTAEMQCVDIGGGISSKGGFSGQPGQAQGSSNLVLVDGVSANTHASGVGFNPISDTVQQVHVENTLYDAQYGWTTGGVINTITKGGTNTWHGRAYEYVKNNVFRAAAWDENYYGVNKNADPLHQNFFGGAVGGPILKNKMFFFFAYEKLLEVEPDSITTSVPTVEEKNGNFSNQFNTSGTLQTIYNPLTTVCPTGASSCTRTAFQGNIIPPDQMNPVAKSVLAYIPDPLASNSGDPYTHLDNWATNVSGAQRKKLDNVPQYSGRLDYNISDMTHMFFRYGWNNLAETRGYAYSFQGQPYNLAETSGNSPFTRQNDDFTLQVTHTFNPTTVLEVRTGLDRFKSISGSSISDGFSVSKLDFSPLYVSQSSLNFPMFRWSNYNGAGANPSGINPSDLTYTNDVILAKTYNKHNMKFGFQNMEIGENQVNPGASAGFFNFTNTYTTADPLNPSSASGNSIADFLLGYPAGGYIQRNSDPKLMMHLYSVFAQDDIQVTPNLTLTAGLRWDYQGALTDRFNALTEGFCTTCANPIQVPGMTLMGGLEYAGVGSNPRGITNPHYNNFGPRFGFAYRTWRDTVVRGGFGIVYAQQWQNPGAAPGFSQTTYILQPPTTGIPVTDLTNPFPDGVLTPVGAANGLASSVGQGVGFTDPNTNIPQVMQYSLSVEHQFRKNWLVSATYMGSYIRRLPVSENLNHLSLPDLALGVGALTSTVDNPLYAAHLQSVNAPYLSVLNGTFMNQSTIQEQQLLLPYPEFGGVTENVIPIGKNKYNGLWLDLNKRMSHGLDFDMNFAWSKTMQAVQFLNPTDPAPSYFLSPYDTPAQVKFSGVWDLPFGPGRMFGANTNPFISRLIGGWQVSSTWRWQAGFPLPAPFNVAPTGASVKTAHQTLNHWFNTCTLLADGTTTNCLLDQTPAWVVLQPDQLQTWSPYMPNMRGPGAFQAAAILSKAIKIKERYNLKIQAYCDNVFNHPSWGYESVDNNALSGTFGQYAPYNTPDGDPRVVMLSMQFEF
ncbi:MAG: TonB-dependent receptor [Acidobacteria bacterium]|nr:TonB-dependent receptor [Acidobacteriota bacterium]